MKKYSKLLLVAFLFASVLFITGCGSKKDEKKDVAGTYKGTYTKFVGDDAKNTDEEFSLELKEDFRTLSINLSKFHYAEKNSTYTITKVKEANTNIINNITKIRKIMSIPQNLNEDKRNFITL